MAQTPVEPEPVFGWRATLFALAFLVVVLGGFGAATAAAEGRDAKEKGSEYSDDHADDKAHDDEDHADE